MFVVYFNIKNNLNLFALKFVQNINVYTVKNIKLILLVNFSFAKNVIFCIKNKYKQNKLVIVFNMDKISLIMYYKRLI